MRSKPAKKRQLKKDLIYGSPLVTRFINAIMQQGKRGMAKSIVYGALNNLEEDREKALRMLEKAVEHVSPREEVRSRRVGGATYQIPIPVQRDRAVTLAVRWIIKAAKKRKGVPMVEKLTCELKGILKGEGAAVAKKDEVRRIAESNRAFAHFRW